MSRPVDLTSILSSKGLVPLSQKIACVWHLSIPGIFAQISSILMQYIDAAMVGSLGAEASASIGLVASTTWLFGGLCMAVSSGFSVQLAQSCGAGDYQKAREIFKQGIVSCLIFSLFLCAIAVFLSFRLPYWLGGSEQIAKNSCLYFLVFALAIPVEQIMFLMNSMLQCSGNMKIPGFLNVLTCLLDVAFNFLFIIQLKMGVFGAALGTLVAEAVTMFLGIFFACVRSEKIGLLKSAPLRFNREYTRAAVKISAPMAFEQAALCGAQVAVTGIVAPLGTIAIAANSFGVTAESLCYMPGYGIGSAATTLVGQSVGAGRKDMARSFARLTVVSGMAVMTFMAVIMYFVCPAVFAFLTPDLAVREIGVKALRIELFAEPLFGASIVAAGALRGAGDTLVPGIMTLASIWGVRITLSLLLAQKYGLSGVWFAMCAELCVRGIVFLVRLLREKWLN